MADMSVGSVVKGSPGWSIALSLLMILAGILAIVVPPVAGIVVVLFVAWLLIFSGAAHLAFAWYSQTRRGVVWELILGVLYLLTGFYILAQPVAGLASLTLVLAFYLFAEAILESVLAFRLRPLAGTGWLLFDSIITLILAIMIADAWPSSSDWALGTLVGISMLCSGVTRLMLSVAAHHSVRKPLSV